MNEQQHPSVEPETIEVYPLVALKNMVVFPRTRMSLAIAREKSVRAVEEALLRADRMLVTVAQRSSEIEDPQPADLYGCGALVEIVTVHRQADGSLQVLLNGLRRVRLLEFQDLEPFMRVSVEVSPEPQVQGPQADALVRHATNLFEHYAQLNRRFSVEDINSIVAIKSPARLADMLAAHVVSDVVQQQDLLETFDPLARLEKVCVFIGNEIEILELESVIRNRVRSQVDRSQKEFYLREQLRAIQEELGMETPSEADELRERLRQKNLPPEAAAKVRKEIDRLEHMPPQSAEIAVVRSYIDWMLALPWNERTVDSFDLERTRRILDEDHYGLESIKERIIEFLAVRQLRLQRASEQGQPQRGSQGQILCFIGPPGVGKTSLGQSIARALGRKFVRIALGGVHDEAEIRGHRRTYVGALPGRIIQSMKSAGVRNPVFLLDEIDKLSSEYRGDPAAALLEVLDPEQNAQFVDHYLEVPYDLSEVFFICTGNVKYQIPRPLADRMDIIDVPGYMLEEKVNIGLRHLLPKVLAEHGLTPEQLKIPRSVMERIVTDYTREAGVRNLERQLAAICRKAARRIIARPSTHLRLTTSSLEQYLGMPRYSTPPLSMRMQVGAAMGLAVTENGGILLPVEVVTMAGKGDLLITGQLGDVMRESAIAALSYIRSRATELNIDPNFQDVTDLHIHLPENAIPKDGPSAGITIATALISALTRRPVRGDVAMTGEITLRGRVLGVGGLKEKILAAHQAGLRHIVVPVENKKDLMEIPARIRQQMRFTLVETMDQVIAAALAESSTGETEADNDSHTLIEPQPRPLHVDERLPASRGRSRSRHAAIENRRSEEQVHQGEESQEQPSLILPVQEDQAADVPQAQLGARASDEGPEGEA
ncbi:MAG: endopeptidase La [Thermogemmatispora sp.]|uniref:endopeptidase La n=1 Tax=Thermogemmatispora sp. TaxID=1968838 RepID=UPI002632CEAC|nr:endopeptidase La [Thermogemmatispora sp.]MBX5455300.1 endopeptidase La [Thermogemmatispora sp.]